MADIKVRLDQKPDATSVDETSDRFVGRAGGKILLLTPTQTKEVVEKLTGLRLYNDAANSICKLQYLNGSGVWTDTGTEFPY